MQRTVEPFAFVDLFAGIGGFHIALGERWGGLGGRCVLTSEIDKDARRVYREQFGTQTRGDIRAVLTQHFGQATVPQDELDDVPEGDAARLPEHDLLAAGFPCQPFSKSGRQEGLEDQTRGTLFFDICQILQERKPRFIVLENVRNIAAHDGGRTWQVIVERLHELGYKVNSKPLVFSPHLLHPDLGGAPQFRERVFILGEHVDYGRPDALDWDFHIANKPEGNWDPGSWDLRQWLKAHPPLEGDLTPYAFDEGRARYQHALAWGELLAALPPGRVPQPLQVQGWRVVPEISGLPEWKQRHNEINSEFYKQHRGLLDDWVARHRPYTWIRSDQKLEWQAQDADRERAEDIFELQLQFRPSGLRVKKPTYTGALVAITQTPYMGWLGRSLTPSEAASLQGVPVHDVEDPYRLHPVPAVAFKQLGNGVNAGVVRYLVRRLFEHCGFDGYRRSLLDLTDAPAAVDLRDYEAQVSPRVDLTREPR